MKDAERIAELEAALCRSELLIEQLQAQLNLRRRKQPARGGVDALAAENARLRAELEQSRDLIVEMSKHCNATALVADWLERNQ